MEILKIEHYKINFEFKMSTGKRILFACFCENKDIPI